MRSRVVALGGLRSEVGSPITHAHKYPTTNDVSYGDRKQVSPQEIDPAEDIRIDPRDISESRSVHQQYSGRDEVHIRNAVLKPDGDEGHDRKEDSEDLPYNLASSKSHPDSQTDQPVTADPAPEGLAEGESGFGIGNLHCGNAQRPVARLPETGEVKYEHNDHRSDEIGKKYNPPSLQHGAESDLFHHDA